MVIKTFAGTRHTFMCLLLFLMAACMGMQEANEKEPIEIIWKDERAVAVTVTKDKLGRSVADDSLLSLLSVRLVAEAAQPAMLGTFTLQGDRVLFEPLIPFTRELSYEVRLRHKPVAEFMIPAADKANAPVLLGVYPEQDTLPRNLLKFYLHFSKPMREGSLHHIALLEERGDTVTDVFLTLQPELWNHDRTWLTLWLDPGRVKRHLQPNEKLGQPLQQHQRYSLAVNEAWTDVNGVNLTAPYQKDFVVAAPDSLSPQAARWMIETPQAGTALPLLVHFYENLDHVLIHEAIQVMKEGSKVSGTTTVAKEGSLLVFVPDQPWAAGNYELQSEARLEDLAGNNLARAFDRDLSVQPAAAAQKTYTRPFSIK